MKTAARMGAALAATATLCLVAAQPASAAPAADFFKCKLKDGATLEQAAAVAAGVLKDAKAQNQMEGYSIRFLQPVYSGDTSNGVFYWVGAGPSIGSVAATNDYWMSEANKAHREAFNALVKSCSSASLHYIIEVPDPE